MSFRDLGLGEGSLIARHSKAARTSPLWAGHRSHRSCSRVLYSGNCLCNVAYCSPHAPRKCSLWWLQRCWPCCSYVGRQNLWPVRGPRAVLYFLPWWPYAIASDPTSSAEASRNQLTTADKMRRSGWLIRRRQFPATSVTRRVVAAPTIQLRFNEPGNTHAVKQTNLHKLGDLRASISRDVHW